MPFKGIYAVPFGRAFHCNLPVEGFPLQSLTDNKCRDILISAILPEYLLNVSID